MEDKKIQEILEKLKNMTVDEKWELVMKSWGMWSNYPKTWLEDIRKGIIEGDIRYE